MRIGTGNRREMVIFKEDVQTIVKKHSLNLKVQLEELEYYKYGERMTSNFADVNLVGTEEEIHKLLDIVNK